MVVGVLETRTHQAAALPARPSATVTGPTTGHHHVSPSVRGEITVIDGDTWTVRENDGSVLTVDLGAHTIFGTSARPASRVGLNVGSRVAVVGTRVGDTVRADRVVTPVSSRGPGVTPTPATTPAPTTALKTCAVNAGLAQAVSYAASQGERSAAAHYDTETGSYLAAGGTDTDFSTASVVKVFIAAELLLTGQMTGDTASTAYQMITTIANHYGISDLGSPPADTGQWGETQVTADGLVHLYAKLKADPVVWPWLSNAMANATQDGTDGTDQCFGIPSAAASWSVKQGWMTGLGPGSTYNSTGFVDGNRYALVILTSGSTAQYGQYMAETITEMAKDVLLGGHVGTPTPACP